MLSLNVHSLLLKVEEEAVVVRKTLSLTANCKVAVCHLGERYPCGN